jgi:putative exporter of polyketide antibiotics
MIKTVHSYWAYLVLIVLLFAVFKAISGVISKKEYDPKMFRRALFTLIVSHIQLLIGLVLYFTSSRFSLWSELGVGEIMKTPVYRLYLVEHPIINILAVVLITIGYSKHKKKRLSDSKYKTLAIFYTIALVFILSRIPWDLWPK